MDPPEPIEHAPRPLAASHRATGAGRAVAAAALLVAAAFIGCGGQRHGLGAGDPLFEPGLVPDFLTESDSIEPPPALAGNRFLTSWRPASSHGEPVLRWSGGSARIELVQIAPRPRTLVFDLDLDLDLDRGPGSPSRSVEVRSAGRSLGRFPLADPLRIPLPADLPLGRSALDLVLEDAAGAAPLLVSGARVVPAAPAGEARWEADRLIQSAASLVDYVRPVPSGAVLAGELVPPEDWRSSQGFALVIEGPDGARIGGAAFSGGWWARLRGPRTVTLPLGETAGLRRFRFLATGPPGPPARWRHLRLTAPAGAAAPAPMPAAIARSPAPRLVVVYVMDALRADRVGHLGGPLGISPTLDALAAEGATFLRHRSVAPNTLPATKALFVGRTPVRRGGGKLPASGRPTLAELFRRAGYRTGLFSGNVHVGPAFGTDRGFEQVARGLEVAKGTAPYNDSAARVHDAALAWLDGLVPEERAFLYLHTIHPHNPYDPPPELAARHTSGIPSVLDGSTRTLLDVQRRRLLPSDADRRRLEGLYDGSFAYNDRELGRFLARLERRAPAGDTLLVVTSDHGEELFDHGGVLHGYTLYEEMLRIPLVLHRPGAIPPGRHESPTDTLDLHATLLELGGLDRSAGSDGRSLAGVLAGRPAAPRVRLAAASSLRGGIFSARSERWKLIRAPRSGRAWGMGEGLGRSRDAEYLFDLRADPGETVNLAGDGGVEPAWLRSLLLAWIEERAHDKAEEEPAEADPETLRELRALGYLG